METKIPNKKPDPMTFEEQILLTVPDNLSGLETDEHLMVKLSKYNSEIVDKCIASDTKYKPIGRKSFEKHKNANDFNEDAYYDVINRIATENSTRSSKVSMRLLAKFLADPNKDFTNKLKEGKPELVDELLQYLIDNNERKDKSLVSKICRYLNEWLFHTDSYTINDSIIRAVLPYYLAYYGIDRSLWLNKNLDTMSYVEFFNLFNLVNSKNEGLTRHQLDHLIWYSYKNDRIRFEMSKALAEIIER